MGGLSAEREVSLNSGAAVGEALREEGYRVTEIDVGDGIACQLQALNPDACFNALHGRWGEDGCVQGILEILGIPYTHSGVLASALAMHKERAKDVMRLAGVPVAEAEARDASRSAREPRHASALCREAGGGRLERRRRHRGAGRRAAAELDRDWRLARTDFDGRALHPRPRTDLRRHRRLRHRRDRDRAAQGLAFYDYEAKYAAGGSRHVLPAQLLPDVYQLVRKLTLKAHQALGCRGVSRADFRFDDTPSGTQN